MASLSWPSFVESAPCSTFRLMLPTRSRHAIESSRHGMTQSKATVLKVKESGHEDTSK